MVAHVKTVFLISPDAPPIGMDDPEVRARVSRQPAVDHQLDAAGDVMEEAHRLLESARRREARSRRWLLFAGGALAVVALLWAWVLVVMHVSATGALRGIGQ